MADSQDRKRNYQFYSQLFGAKHSQTARNLRNKSPDRPVNIPPELDNVVTDAQRGTVADNLRRFRDWSSHKGEGFPPNIQAFIDRINRQAGFRIGRNSYGYRVFYRMYVLGRSQDFAVSRTKDMIDRGVGSP